MKKLILLAGAVLCLMSCKKFLAEKTQSDVVPKTAKDFGEILYTNGYPDKEQLLQQYLLFMDDDVQCYNGSLLADMQIMVTGNAPAYQWQPNFIDECSRTGSDDYGSFNSWSIYYKLILGTNVALQYMDNSIGSATEKAQYKGEAYALRAFYYFNLVNLYAAPYNDSTTTPDKSPGVPLKLDANLTEQPLERNSVKEVYTQITSDLDSAIYYLGINKSEQKLYRISHVAVHLLASRVYLYMEQWDKAIANADYVIANHPQLMDLNNWGYPDPDNKPIIGVGNVETLWYYGSKYEHCPTSSTMAYDVSADLRNCFESNDLRTAVFFMIRPDELKPYVLKDYLNEKNSVNLGVGPDGQYNMGSSWRSAEAYLNRAEAYVQLYKTKGDGNAAQQALLNLNQLRAKRFDPSSFTPWTIHPANELLQMCRDERRRELFTEGTHRWMDLRRYGMPEISHYYMPTITTTQRYTLKKHDPQYTLPIPNAVLRLNRALVQNPQMGSLRQPD
ncbi:RagB/SusD family nutrient uptake outer membrane protein [Chitinophaga sp. Hz27]|uniref:RagB/SusD family nutrient uptake outer membrane protein n=1 Tax=Chitinophaga sp. Hz27 TaxID=3347169 RepID=UPI0035E0CA6F